MLGRVVTTQNPTGEVTVGMPVILAEQVLFECGLVDTGTQMFDDGTQIDFCVFKAGRAARRRCHIEYRTDAGIDIRLPQQQFLMVLIDQLGSYAADIMRKLQVTQT